MDIGYKRNPTALANLHQSFSRIFIRHGATHNVTAGSSQPLDLCQGRRDIPSVGTAHGLNSYRRSAADGEITDQNLTGLLRHNFILLRPLDVADQLY